MLGITSIVAHTTLHCSTLHCSTLHCPLHCPLHYTSLPPTLHYTALHTALHCPPHYTSLPPILHIIQHNFPHHITYNHILILLILIATLHTSHRIASQGSDVQGGSVGTPGSPPPILLVLISGDWYVLCAALVRTLSHIMEILKSFLCLSIGDN